KRSGAATRRRSYGWHDRPVTTAALSQPEPGRRSRHEAWMRRALAVAQGDRGSHPAIDADVPVGAIVFGPEGVELGAGRNEREATGDPTAHAEIVALRAAARRTGGWRLD